MSANDDAERKKIERELRETSDQLRVFRGRRPLGVSDAPPEGPTCSFCGLAKNQVKVLVEAPYANICNGCIDLCQDIVRKGLQMGCASNTRMNPDPHLLRSALALWAGYAERQQATKLPLAMTSSSIGMGRLVKTTLLVGVPLSLLGVVLGWNTHPGGGLFFLVALIPSALLASREIIPREYFWFVFPIVQFAYYFVWVSLAFGVRALFKGGGKAA